MNCWTSHLNHALEYSPKGSSARKSLNIALLNPAGLMTSFGLASFTGKGRTTKHIALYPEMYMFCANLPCQKIRRLLSSPLALTTGKVRREPLSFTARVIVTRKLY